MLTSVLISLCGRAGTDALQWFDSLEIKVTFKSQCPIRVDCLNPWTQCVTDVCLLMGLSVSECYFTGSAFT